MINLEVIKLLYNNMVPIAKEVQVSGAELPKEFVKTIFANMVFSSHHKYK